MWKQVQINKENSPPKINLVGEYTENYQYRDQKYQVGNKICYQADGLVNIQKTTNIETKSIR
jgi:hypothetical protein